MAEGFSRHRAKVLLAVIGVSVILGGCDTTRGLERPVVSEVAGSIEIAGEMYSAAEHAMSPDGKHVLAAVRDGEGTHLVLVRFVAGDPVVVRIESISRTWIEKASCYYMPIGWISETRFLYAKIGWQPDGSKKNQRGMLLLMGETTGARPEEVAFIPLSSGGVRMLLLPEQGKLFICSDPIPSYSPGDKETVKLWEFDPGHKTVRMVRDDIPYDPYRKPVPSPAGQYYVYAREEEGRAGLYILDTTTGQERVLAPNGDTRSFYPAWSFDGKYIALYTVSRRSGARGTAWYDYNIFEGEDTAQPVGESITVLDPQGNVVSSIRVEGHYLTSFRWAHNSHSLAFLTGTESSSEGMRTLSCDALWLGRMGNRSGFQWKKLATVPLDESGKAPWTIPVAFDASGEGVYYWVYDRGTWYAREGAEAVQVSGGAWFPSAEVPPEYNRAVLALVDEPGSKTALCFMVAGECVRFAEYPRVEVLAYNGDTLVVFAGSGDLPYHLSSGTIVFYRISRE